MGLYVKCLYDIIRVNGIELHAFNYMGFESIDKIQSREYYLHKNKKGETNESK